MPDTFTSPPSRADLFAWLGLVDPGGDPGDTYDLALQVAVNQQEQVCLVRPYSAELHAAALRRAARFLAAKGLALGTVDTGDLGTVTLPRWDGQIESLESNWRRGGFA